MKLRFFTNENGRSPVRDYITRLRALDREMILGSLENIEELGFNTPRIKFRQIRGKLWEIKIRLSSGQYRIFYCSVAIDEILLLHVYKKKSQKAPQQEIELALKRMKEM